MTKIYSWCIGFRNAGLAIVVVAANQAYAAGAEFVGDANSCVSVQGNQIANGCSSAVSIVWCAETNQGDTCDAGFKESSNTTPGGYEVIHPLPDPGLVIQTVQGIACKMGPNGSGLLLQSKDYQPEMKRARCVSDKKLYSIGGPKAITVPVVPYKKPGT